MNPLTSIFPQFSSPSSDLRLPAVDFARKGYRILIFLRGLPGSGKSALSEELLNQIIGPCDQREFIFSADDYFLSNGVYNYNSDLLSDAHDWCQKRAYNAIINHTSPVIVANTNVQLWQMEPYARWGVEQGYRIVIQEPDTPWQFNVEELARRNKHDISGKKISFMLNSYDKDVTVERLFQEYRLDYNYWKPPVMRNYPKVLGQGADQEAGDSQQENVAVGRTACSKLWLPLIPTFQDASVGTEDADVGWEVVATRNFVNNGRLPFKYPKYGSYDKSTMTDNDY